jgi:tetratricopeptide (TPR) repeat protein
LFPSFISAVLLLSFGTISYYSFLYFRADLLFAKAITMASQNKSSLTYQYQKQALLLFPFKDTFHQQFSQTDFALANALAAQQPKDKQPDAKTQQTIYFLIQEAIDHAKQATTLSPQTSLHWQNLSTIYRGIIGFGQNAQDFSLATMQQAILLDPTNPQLYVTFGGIYYQLGQWDNAAKQFQTAITVKPDFANAYYNLGHTLEQKQDYKNAKTAYERVKALVANNPASEKVITADIQSIEKKMNKETEDETPLPTPAQTATLGISSPSASLPIQKSPYRIPLPTKSPAK